ncbi:MAG: hypothetical protein KAJ55_16360 [Anaerolineales bacterium]|nr:hypothetical protein [Anaerolineales bacterium]
MKFNPVLGSELSGSIGGFTASHNRGGSYFRKRVVPVDPGTAFQLVIRGFVSDLTSLWLNTLTTAQRTAWDLYALQVPLPDALGEPRNVGGLAMYVRSNVPRLQAGEPRVDAGPTTFNLGDYTQPVMAAPSEAGQTVSWVFTPADDWANEDDAGMLFLISRPQNASINFFKGPYRFAAVVQGDSLVPPVSPVVMPLPFAFVAGQRIFAEVKVTRADGRLSAKFRTNQLAIA